MNPGPWDVPIPAEQLRLPQLGLTPDMLAQFQQLHELVAEVCPHCPVTQRNLRGGIRNWIYVPAERQGETVNKNLLTVWDEGDKLRMRIMEDDANGTHEEEYFDLAKVDEYRGRMQRLYARMLEINRRRASRVS